jgi:hypothetical protein
VAATLMRRILVGHAGYRARDKRGGAVVFTAISGEEIASAPKIDALALDEALGPLEATMSPGLLVLSD